MSTYARAPVRPYARDVEAIGKLSKAQSWVLNYIDEIQEAKLQPKGKIVVYEYKADNSRKIMVYNYFQSSTDTRNGVRTVKITKK